MKTPAEQYPESKQAEAILYESEERFRSAFEYAAIGMALVALDGGWWKVNRSLCELLGYSEQELLVTNFQNITHPDDLDIDLDYVEQLLSSKISHYQMEKRYFHKQGYVVWTLLSVSLVCERLQSASCTNGECQPLYFIAQIQDISDRKQAEVELEKRTQMLDLANDTIIIRDLGDRITYWNQGAEKLYGWNKEEVLEKNVNNLLQTIFPKPIEEIKAELFAQGHWQGELIDTKRDGTSIVVASRWTLQYDEQRNPTAILEIGNDITQRKQVEILLQQTTQFQQAILDSTNYIIISSTVDGTIVTFNRAAERLLGYTAAEVVGKTTPAIIHDPLEVVEHAQTLSQELGIQIEPEFEVFVAKAKRGGVEEREWSYIRKDGSRFPVLLSVTGLRDGEENITGFLGIASDLSEKKQTEAALKRAKKELEVRVEERTAELRQALEQLQLDMVERQQAEAALRQSEQRYSSLVTATSQIVWLTDAEGRTLGAMSGWEAFTGQTQEQMQGWGWLEMIHPDDRERISQLWSEAVATKTLFENEYRLQAKDGTYREFFSRGVPVLDAEGNIREWVGTSTDITDRKRAEEARRKSEELYRTFARNFPNGSVLLFDQELRYILAEGTHLANTGFTKEQLEGKTIWEVLPPETYATLEPLYRAALTGETKLSEISYADRIYQIHTVPVRNEQGEIFAGMVIAQDITVQKQAEQVLKNAKEELEIRVKERTRELAQANAALQAEIADRLEAQQQLEQVAADLNRSNQELEQFAYVASHDLQEPLRAVTGYTQLLGQEYRDRLDESALEYVGYIVDGATRMQQLIRDLLIYSRVGTRTQELALTDCNAVLRQAQNNLQIAIAETKASITHDPLPTLIADNNQLVQLFQNLIGNAIKFNRKGELPQVHIEAQLNDGEWLFSVRDNGIGIKPQYLERIFVIFKRLHTRKEFSGTGIGLAICKKIVERHGGRIWVQSQLGVGTTFYFTIPQLADSSPELATNLDD